MTSAPILLAVLAACLLLAGCQTGNQEPRGTRTFWVDTVDGRHIPCVAIYRGGLSCDWNPK